MNVTNAMCLSSAYRMLCSTPSLMALQRSSVVVLGCQGRRSDFLSQQLRIHGAKATVPQGIEPPQPELPLQPLAETWECTLS